MACVGAMHGVSDDVAYAFAPAGVDVSCGGKGGGAGGASSMDSWFPWASDAMRQVEEGRKKLELMFGGGERAAGDALGRFAPSGLGQDASDIKDSVRDLLEREAAQLPVAVAGRKLNETAAFAGDHGPKVVTGSQDYLVRIWSVQSGKLLRVLEGHREARRPTPRPVPWPTHLKASPTAGPRLALPAKRCAARAPVVTGSLAAASLSLGADNAACVVWSQAVRCLTVLDNGLVASGSVDTSIRIWRLGDGTCVNVLRGHTAPVRGLVALPGGRLASASDDTSLRLWVHDKASLHSPGAAWMAL